MVANIRQGRTCPICGKSFTPMDDTPICPVCRRGAKMVILNQQQKDLAENVAKRKLAWTAMAVLTEQIAEVGMKLEQAIKTGQLELSRKELMLAEQAMSLVYSECVMAWGGQVVEEPKNLSADDADERR